MDDKSLERTKAPLLSSTILHTFTSFHFIAIVCRWSYKYNGHYYIQNHWILLSHISNCMTNPDSVMSCLASPHVRYKTQILMHLYQVKITDFNQCNHFYVLHLFLSHCQNCIVYKVICICMECE